MKYVWSWANSRIYNYHHTQEYTMAAIKPLLSLCQSMQGKVKGPSHSSNFCWPFQGDASNPANFLKIPQHLLEHSQHNQHWLSKNKQSANSVCGGSCTQPRRSPSQIPVNHRVAWIRRHFLTHCYDTRKDSKREKRLQSAMTTCNTTIVFWHLSTCWLFTWNNGVVLLGKVLKICPI